MYDETRQVFSGAIDRRPALIVRAADADDVRRVVVIAREAGIELAVRSGGHSAAGHSTTDGGIVLDLRDLKGIELDVNDRTVWAETGLTAGELSTATGKDGLVIGFGDTGSVGIGGITLGGGVGYLVRKHGLTIDSLLAADIVTADGELLRIDADRHPDLFWAIRGGGGNFGVVTRFRYRLQPLPQIVGGTLMLPATPEGVTRFIALSESAPDELTTIANVMNCPPLPFVPVEHHGRIVIFGTLCYAGPREEGERAIAPFRALGTPIADMVRPMAYHQIYPPENWGDRPKAETLTMFMERFDGSIATLIDQHSRASDASVRVVQLRVLGGAMARVPVDATAFAHRRSRIMANVASFFDGPEDRPRRRQWVEELSRALRGPDRGAYVGFLGDEGPERVRAAYPGATWDRLAAVKARYDPANLFRLNQNVPPAR
jgi:FAD/FMN-containing dehydrogenase